MRLVFILVIINCFVKQASAQELKILKYTELEKILTSEPGKPKLINFWATWCKPCVEELPYFMSLQQEAKNENVQFIFISLDFMSQTTKVKELINKLSLTGTLLQLNESGGEWIDEFDSNWSGAIPYTVLLLPDGEKREHYDAFNSPEELRTFINKNISN
ncbi:MAG: TlpA family protein disulfide reductase [Chitinophagaceae bacterium]|nr:TlpA family protein disulfide reductase [Chitinophagaceae bacterium]